jgi:hypothetical protein
MATTPTPAPSTSKLQTILGIINAALQGLTMIPGLGTGVAAAVGLEQLLQGILTNALQAYQAEAGQPIDLTKIPLETPYIVAPVPPTAIGPEPVKKS